jgi:hypothetical protein
MQRSFWTLIALLAVVSHAAAGMITGVTLFPGPARGVGPGMGFVNVPIISTPSPNNDDQPGGPGGDNNITVPNKRFDFPGYIDIEFVVSSTAGITEYKVIESVDNDTGIDWAHYRMELGYGVGAAFVRSTGVDTLDFDAPLYTAAPSSSGFSTVSMSPDVLVFTGGIHNEGLESYQIRIDVPDLTSGKFTLRQIPIVPEPMPLVLVAIGTAAYLLIGVRRRRSLRQQHR